ncbi:MAG: glucose-6-phosphate dehydrogenase assembly protein OpcA [Oscillochloris sp.]|nr:glucose-6-phosphate dehydrogenase assembly protein OpcA [Oscillochloris sp.]
MTTSPSVDLTSIERELRQIWKQNAADAPGGQAVTRALTLNLVAKAGDPVLAEQISALFQSLTAGHPHRGILLVDQGRNDGVDLTAFVQANCLLTAPGVPQVCGEQVTIRAATAALGRAASLVLALLVPDLPVALYLPGPEPLGDPLLARLRGILDRLIVDSADFTTPAPGLYDMAELNDLANGPAVSDLSWTRLTAWRELTAQFFDTRPLLPHLRRIDQIEIIYADGQRQHNPSQALLLAGWLSASLGWAPLEDAVSQEGDLIRLHLRRPAVGIGPNAIRLVTIDLKPGPAVEGDMVGLAALNLRALDGMRAEFNVVRTEDPTRIRTTAHVAGQPAINRIAAVDQGETAALLAAELQLRSRDRTFGAALRTAATFARRLQG